MDANFVCWQAGQLRSRFERALRRLFRIYDVDRDGLLGDNELNAFQYNSFQVYLSEEDITALNKVSHTPPYTPMHYTMRIRCASRI